MNHRLFSFLNLLNFKIDILIMVFYRNKIELGHHNY